MDAIDFRKVRNILQPIFMGTIVSPKATHEVLVLSDSGSTVGFTVKSFMATIGVIPSGLWRGHLETVNEVRYHEINFYRVRFLSPDGGGVRDVLCLETPSLGKRDPLPDDLVEDVARAFQVATTKIFTAGGDVNILLGQDTAALLLNKMEIKATQATQCPFYEDISLHTSPATTFISIVGAIGEGSAVNEESRNYRAQSHRIKPLQSKIQDGNFCFHSNPEKTEVEIIQKYFSQFTYSVKRREKLPALALSVKDQEHPGKDGDPDGNGNHDSQDPPFGGPGPSASQSQQSKSHSMENNLKSLKQYFGQSKALKQISPLKIIFILNFSLFAHTQLILPIFSPFSPEYTYGQKPYSSNGLNDARSESADQWPIGQTGSPNLYCLNSTDWPSEPLVDLIRRKKSR